MSNTYTWSISYMDTKPSMDELNDVVVSCQWNCVASTGGETPTTASNYGYANFESPVSGNFTAYASLTQEQVLEWVWDSGVDKANVESGLDDKIHQQLNPPTVIMANPWM